MPNSTAAGRDFHVMWAGQTLSTFGSAVSVLALPSVAVLTLHATPLMLGMLEALGYAAFPVLGLVAGVIADRSSRRRLMIASDALRALMLCSVPVAAALRQLSFAQLAMVALFTGIGTVFFDVSYQAYLPALVAKSELSRSNARLEFTRSLAELAGNGVAGLLISLVGAAAAVAVDGASFVLSIASLLAIRAKETARVTLERPTFGNDLREGLATVFQSPILRTIAACTATSNLGGSMVSAVLLIFAYRDAHIAPVALGLIFGFANVGFIGAALAARLADRFGLGRVLGCSIGFANLGFVVLPFALHGYAIGIFFAMQLMQTIGAPIYNINQLSLRQTIVPEALQGRMNATMRTIVWGIMPVGALLGGLLGNTIGIIPTLVTAAVIANLASLWIFLGPTHKIQSIAAHPTKKKSPEPTELN